MAPEVLFLSIDLSPGERARVARVARRMRQIDLAAAATERLRQDGQRRLKVDCSDVLHLERDWRLNRRKKAAMLAILGLEDDDREAS